MCVKYGESFALFWWWLKQTERNGSFKPCVGPPLLRFGMCYLNKTVSLTFCSIPPGVSQTIHTNFSAVPLNAGRKVLKAVNTGATAPPGWIRGASSPMRIPHSPFAWVGWSSVGVHVPGESWYLCSLCFVTFQCLLYQPGKHFCPQWQLPFPSDRMCCYRNTHCYGPHRAPILLRLN